MSMDAVVDTGFDGALTLSAHDIGYVGLNKSGESIVTLADGSQTPMDIYHCEVDWNGHIRQVSVLKSEEGGLIGTRLLYGHRLTIDAIDGGAVTIEPLNASGAP